MIKSRSIVNFEVALKLDPNFEMARSQKMLQQAHICDWLTLENDLKFVPTLGMSKQEISALSMMSFEDAPDRHQLRAKKHVLSNYVRTPIPAKPIDQSKSGKIKVGYFSTDFKTHPVYHQIARVFELHDRDRFEIFGYSLGNKTEDPMTERAINSFNHFHHVANLSDREIALQARKDDLDLAIDLNGYTAGCRPGIFAYRAAPIQINFLGFPGTMGANFIDYIIGDSVLISEDLEKFYDEKIIKLPNSYMPNDNTRVISGKKITRAEMGLPNQGFVFLLF
jgi:predicted O-linked N-acetylglucosamine transferase (SPINDLY family)